MADEAKKVLVGNIKGPKGDKGEDGSPGARGAQGIQGDPGPNLVNGDTATTLNGMLFGDGSKVTAKPMDEEGGVASHDALATYLQKVTQELAGKAPAGGGYNESMSTLVAESASESYETFFAKVDAILAKMPEKSTKQLSGYPPVLYGSGYSAMTLYKYNSNIAVLQCLARGHGTANGLSWIIRKNQTWQPFEWVDPPIAINTEYRTTERYQGKPVYAQYRGIGKAIATAGTQTIYLNGTDGSDNLNIQRGVSVELYSIRGADRAAPSMARGDQPPRS